MSAGADRAARAVREASGDGGDGGAGRREGAGGVQKGVGVRKIWRGGRSESEADGEVREGVDKFSETARRRPPRGRQWRL